MVYEEVSGKGEAELAAYYLQNGKGTHAYRYFGVHRIQDRVGWWYVFRVAAPGADAVFLVGEFNAWEPAPMQKIEGTGIWEIIIGSEICPEGLRYKYRVHTGAHSHDKADPYARMSECSGEGASYICTDRHYVWQDADYLARRAKQYGDRNQYAFPLNIYEVVPSLWFGSEMRQNAGEAKPLDYRMLADLLAQYAADMGYTHVLLPSPCVQGKKQQGIVAMFAPDRSLGTPDDFAYFIDRMHKEGIGVLLELCCVHPGKHSSGLCNFDGDGLYTKQNDNEIFFAYSDPYASTLLYSSALFWMREFHADGLYLDTAGMEAGRESGEFVRGLSYAVRSAMSEALLILRAGCYHGLSAEQSLGGLGYDLVINPHVESALLECFAMTSELRIGRAAWREPLREMFRENAIVALSSALCAQQAGSVFGSLQGTHTEAFAQMRTLLLYLFAIPGKKLLFMGNEIAQPTPANQANGVEWFLRELEQHESLRNYVKSLNSLYLSTPALWECDCSKAGFGYIQCENAPQGVVSFKRFDRVGREICAVFNLSDHPAKDARLDVGGRYPYYSCVFHTNPQEQSIRLQTDGRGYLALELAQMSGMLLMPDPPYGGFWFENV